MIRLDKFLCDCNIGSRSQVEDYIRLGQVKINNIIIKKTDTKLDENHDIVTFRGTPVSYRKYAYYMLNKPAGVVSATTDNTSDTVISLLKDVSDKDLFPVGRLDKDTTGLLFITNDGELAHNLLAPKKHVDKVYEVIIREPLSEHAVELLESGVDIGDETTTLPSKVQIMEEHLILLTIHEGRFHQVKRMLKAIGNEVISLKRIAFGSLKLDPSLEPGAFRELTEKEINHLLTENK